MFINNTRRLALGGCKKAAFNSFHRRITKRSSMSIITGASVHEANAIGLATGDWVAAKAAALTAFDADVAKLNLLPEETFRLADHRDITSAIVDLYREEFEGEKITMVQPECEFEVPLTPDGHNCIFRHWINYETGEHVWREPSATEILTGLVKDPHPGGYGSECRCWSQHTIVGKVDGVFLWKGALWIMDHKTTALHPASFWSQWELDYQLTIYIYGMKKALGIRPNGFVINAVFKPSEAQVSNWNSKRKSGVTLSEKDYLKFSKEAFLRTDADVERCRRDFVSTCEEWEWRIKTNNWPMQPGLGTCNNYNRDCEYKPLCREHDLSDVLSTYPVKAELDYVEKKLIQISSNTNQ